MLQATVAPASTPLTVGFRIRRFAVVLGLLVGYAWYYVCRYSLNYVGPALAKEEGLDMSRIGLLVSVGQISVGFSKMGGSVCTADLSPTLCLVLGLVLTGASNVLAAMVPSFAGDSTGLVFTLGLMWGINGLWQGLGSPACARVLDAWCRPEERGTFWSVWNTSNNLGGALAPILVGLGMHRSGWRGGLCVAGMSAFAMAVGVAALVRDTPGKKGGDASAATKAASGKGAATGEASSQALASPLLEEDSVEQMRGWELFWWGCFRQRGVGRLAAANFLIYAVRATFISWFAFYILEGGRLGAAAAASLLSAFEVGGLFGSLASGVLSDGRAARHPDGPIVGIRVETSLLAVAGLLLPAVAAICVLPASAGPATFVPVLFCAGFGLYVAQSLTALCGLELVPRKAVGVSQGFLGLAAYVGAAAAGLPLGILIQGPMGWTAWHMSLLLSCLGVIAVLLPLRRVPSYGQRNAERLGLPPESVAPLKASEWPRARRVARLAAAASRRLGLGWLRRSPGQRGEGTLQRARRA